MEELLYFKYLNTKILLIVLLTKKILKNMIHSLIMFVLIENKKKLLRILFNLKYKILFYL